MLRCLVFRTYGRTDTRQKTVLVYLGNCAYEGGGSAVFCLTPCVKLMTTYGPGPGRSKQKHYQSLPGHCFLKGSWTSIDTILMNHLAIADQMFRSQCPTKLPAGDGECLASRTDGYRSIPHTRYGGHADHFVVFKDLYETNNVNYLTIDKK